MHNTANRRSRALSIGSRVGVAVLTAALALSGLATGAAAEQSPEVFTAEQRASVLETARAEGARRLDMRANSINAAAGPETCRTQTNGEGITLTRYAGASRYDTAVCVSYWTWFDYADTTPDVPKANAVVLARGDAFPDALAGGPLAGYVNGPLLLTTPTSLLPSVKTELQRVLEPNKGKVVYLLGGTGSLSSGVASSITSLGYTVKRLAGSDRYQTAIRIAQEMPSTNLFFVTTGTNFPDALAAGTYSATATLGATRDSDPATKPVALLFSNGNRMPSSTGNFIANRAGEHGNLLLLMTAGGSAEQAATSAFGSNVVEPYTGRDRYETAALIGDGLFTDGAGKLVGWGVGLSSGTNFPDALAGTGMLMLYAQPLLLTNPTSLSYHTKVFLQNHAGDVLNPDTGQPDAFLDVLGGTGAVSTPVANAAMIAFS